MELLWIRVSRRWHDNILLEIFYFGITKSSIGMIDMDFKNYPVKRKPQICAYQS